MFDKIFLQIQAMSWHTKIFALVLAFFAPLASLIHVIIALLFVDAITSIYYQMKLIQSGQKDKKFIASLQVIESRKLRKTLEKMFFYVLIIIMFFIFDTYVLQVKPIAADAIYTFSITNIAAVLICMVELTSIASNVSKITGNKVFDRIVSIFSKKVEKKFDIDEE
jgi:hypothetical protein